MLALVDSQLILKSLTLSPGDEVYLLDANTMELLYVNDIGQASLGGDYTTVALAELESVLGVSKQTMLSHVHEHKHQKPFFELSLNKALPTANINKNQLRVMLIQSGQNEYILVTKSDISPNEKVVMALSESESRFQAIVSNIPGLVFEMQMNQDQQLNFSYVSEGCEALLGMTASELEEDAQLLFSIMNARDRVELRTRLMESVEKEQKLDWEGRVWIDGWQDTKWINLRATTKTLDNGVTQWDGIMINVTQSKLEKEQIEQSRRDLELLTTHMNHVKEQERISIAREIHDDLGGNLTAIKMGLAGLAQQASDGEKISSEQTSNLESIVNRTFESIHRISGNLRPNILDLGIVDALEWQLAQFKKQVGIDCKFKTNQSEILLASDQAMALFRICQESLSNIAKYAQASFVTIDLNATNQEVSMDIIDNGVGIKNEDKLKVNSFGLRGMQERVGALHGALSIGTPEYQSCGTKVSVKIPI